MTGDEVISIYGYKESEFNEKHVALSIYDKKIAEDVMNYLRELSKTHLINSDFEISETFLIAGNKMAKEIDNVFSDKEV